MPRGDRRDHAVDHASGRDADGAAVAVDASGAFEVGGGVEGEELEADEQAPQL